MEYYILLLLITLFIVIGLIYNQKYSPKKIRYFLDIALTFLFIKNVVLIVMIFLRGSSTLIYLKYLTYIEYILLPIIMGVIWYINLRSEKLKFNMFYYILGVLSFLYIYMMHNSSIKIGLALHYGFIITLSNEKYLTAISLIILGVILILNIAIQAKPFINKRENNLEIILNIVMMLELALISSKVILYPYPLISELFTICLLGALIKKFKNKKRVY